MSAPLVGRRMAFSGLGALGVAVALAGCGGGDGNDGGSQASVEAGTQLATTADVPVSGGVILTDERIVITQPNRGTFEAFTAVCTHQNLLVTSVEDGVIRCANHGSSYSAATGTVEGGPATSALAAVAIEVRDDKIFAA